MEEWEEENVYEVEVSTSNSKVAEPRHLFPLFPCDFIDAFSGRQFTDKTWGNNCPARRKWHGRFFYNCYSRIIGSGNGAWNSLFAESKSRVFRFASFFARWKNPSAICFVLENTFNPPDFSRSRNLWEKRHERNGRTYRSYPFIEFYGFCNSSKTYVRIETLREYLYVKWEFILDWNNCEVKEIWTG